MIKGMASLSIGQILFKFLREYIFLEMIQKKVLDKFINNERLNCGMKGPTFSCFPKY